MIEDVTERGQAGFRSRENRAPEPPAVRDMDAFDRRRGRERGSEPESL